MNETSSKRVSEDGAAAHYDRVSEAWRFLLGENLHYGVFSGRESLRRATVVLTRMLAGMARLGPAQCVLDVGCGLGAPAMFLAREHGCEVIGISTSAVGVATATARALEEGLSERVEFHLEDAQEMTFDAARFDRVWALESSHLMEDKRAMMSEFFRVLRPLGRIALCDIVMARRLPLEDVLRLASEFDLLRRVFGRAKMLTLEEYGELARDVGFGEIVLRDLTRETLPTFDRWRANAEENEERVAELMGVDALRDFRHACGILGSFWQDGILGYGALSAVKG
jgi:cyclopropane fatty-acyl-phospholipid synthase-like methyltransferase